MSWKFGHPDIDKFHNDIIGIWKLDESSGTRYDSFGSRNLSDNSGTTGSAVGKDNDGADFESSNSDYLKNSTELTNSLTAFSCSCWIYLESINQSNPIVWEAVDTSRKQRVIVRANASNQLHIAMRDVSGASAGKGTTSSNTFTTATWYHILAVIDTVNDVIRGWVNGSSWINYSVSMGSFYNAASGEDWRVGSHYDVPAVTDRYFDGIIDELYIWSAALDANAASALYNGGNGRFWRNHPANFFGNG